MYLSFHILSRHKETRNVIIYTNEIAYKKPQPINNTEITRDNILLIPVRCKLDRDRLLGEYFVPRVGMIYFTEEGYGNFTLSLNRYPDDNFDHPVVHRDVEVLLGEPLYFAVNLTSVNGLTVFAENCWATPTPNPNDRKTYPFIERG